MIEKNEKKGVGGNKRFYYDCCLLCEESLEQIRKKRILKETKMNDLKELSKENTIESFCVAAFITFNTIKDQEDFLYKNNQNCCSRLIDAFINLFTIYFYCLCPYCCCCCGCCCFCCCRCSCCYKGKYKNSLNFYKKKITFERAPEPEDVIFENLEIGFKTKFKNIICVSFISLSSSINFFLYIYQTIINESDKDIYTITEEIEQTDYIYVEYSKTNKTIGFYVTSLLITIITAVIDLILEIVLEKLIKCQKSYTLTNFQATYSINLSFFWILNTCLIPSIYESMFSSSSEHELITNNLFTKFIFNSFVTPIMWTINVKCLYKKIKKCIIEQKDRINYNQKELNELYELQSMNIAAKYSYLVKTVLMSFFFASVFPLGFGISFIGLIFAYWLEKFNFSKMYKKPEKLDKQIAEYYIAYFFIIFYAFSLGSLQFLIGYNAYFDFDFHDPWITTILIISNALLFIPFQLCFKKDFLNLKESKVHKKTYDDMYLYFINDYERANPMTRIEGEMKYLDKLQEKNKINKKENDRRKKKIKEQNQLKFYMRKQRLSRILNINELNFLLNLDDDEQKN